MLYSLCAEYCAVDTLCCLFLYILWRQAWLLPLYNEGN